MSADPGDVRAHRGNRVWSLGSSLAGGLLAALNRVRAGRPAACQMLLAMAFGKSIGNMLDPRALGHAVIAEVLVAFSLVTLRRIRVRV